MSQKELALRNHHTTQSIKWVMGAFATGGGQIIVLLRQHPDIIIASPWIGRFFSVATFICCGMGIYHSYMSVKTLKTKS